jgi:hypothetical protein
MGTVTTSLRERAQSIFADLGYSVSTEGSGLRAERKWRTVQVTPMPEPDDLPVAGDFHCFVTWDDRVGALERRVQGADPDYDWAIIGIREGEDYEVARRSS